MTPHPSTPTRHRPGRRGAAPGTRRAVVLALVTALLGIGAPAAHASTTAPDLAYAIAADYSGPIAALDGTTLSGKVAIFLRGAVTVSNVAFTLDGKAARTEGTAPYDLSGDVAGQSHMLDTSALAVGAHTVGARVTTTTGSTYAVTATFSTGVGTAVTSPTPATGLMYSSSADYSAPRTLDGAAVTGPIAVFVPTAVADIASVAFTLDGTPVRTERSAPWDLSGDTGGRSHMLDTTALTAGTHTVEAVITTTTGARLTGAATFATGNPPVLPPAPPAGTRTLTVTGNAFQLDGAPFDMWGIRTASATYTQAQTDHLIAQLDTYRAHGVNTVAVYYMGSRNANYDPFSTDGTSVDAGHQARMEQIIRAADARGMVVVAGIFYQAAPLRLRDAQAVRDAVATVTRALKPYRNVVINIANEQSSSEYGDTAAVFDFRSPSRIIELLGIVNSIDPDRVAGGGGYSRTNNIAIGKAAVTDVLLFDTGMGTTREQLPEYQAFVAAGIRKPAVNVEQFGGYTNSFERGIFSTTLKAKYAKEVATADAEPGLYTFFHNGPWVQVLPMRYDLGGAGTATSPGIRWYFEDVRAARR